jgi:hypothetical protein
LDRFYNKISKLKALRIWDRFVTDANLIATGQHCRNLERFYLDGQDARMITLTGLIGMLNALHTKYDSKLKRIGLYRPAAFHVNVGGHPEMMDDEDDDMEDIEDMDDDGDGVGNAAPALPAPPRHIDLENLPIYKFLDVLCLKHPYLERLSLIGCVITDDIVPVFGRFANLQSLDLHEPIGQGLSGVGIARLVQAFQGKNLSSLDLANHLELSEDDMNVLTGQNGLKTLRYIRVVKCPKLADKYLVDEWVHPSDFVMEDGTWTPRASAGRNLLEIGQGWQENWME